MPELSNYEKLLQDIITRHQDGLSEYDLLEFLRNKERKDKQESAKEDYRDNLNLFRTHFLLFHSLYLLQKKLYQNQAGCLEVDPLKIIIRPYMTTRQDALSIKDPLRDYYLDINNLENTTEEDVENMLTSFWEKYLANEHRQEALEALGLQDPIDHESIRKRYKHLAMEHHPDRGGDKDKLQVINAAMNLLKQ